MATYHGLNEDETCRTFVLPALARAGWRNDQVRPQYRINEGRLVATSRYHARSEPLIADYVLEYGPDLSIGVVEAKRTRAHAADGIEQAKPRLFTGVMICRVVPIRHCVDLDLGGGRGRASEAQMVVNASRKSAAQGRVWGIFRCRRRWPRTMRPAV